MTSKVVCPDCGVTIVDCRRYRLEALAEFMRLSMSATCIAVNVSGSTQKGGRCHGITRQLVERIAAQLMAHPAEIWPEVIDHDIEDSQVACEECGTPFIPFRRGHRWCSNRCRNRRRQRELYQTDPMYRARRRAQRRRTYDETSEYERARQRRHYRITGEAERRKARYATDPEYRARRIAESAAYRARRRGEGEQAA